MVALAYNWYIDENDVRQTMSTPDLVVLMNDRLPLEVCMGSNGVLVLTNAIIWAWINTPWDPNDLNSGWQPVETSLTLQQ